MYGFDLESFVTDRVHTHLQGRGSYFILTCNWPKVGHSLTKIIMIIIIIIMHSFPQYSVEVYLEGTMADLLKKLSDMTHIKMENVRDSL